MKKNYTYTGKCIWCGKRYPEVTFNTAPHIIPKAVGGKEIGLDICDDCNHYFGTHSRDFYSTNVVIKEMYLASSAFHIKGVAKKKRFSSAFFHFNTDNYRVKEKIHIKMSVLTSSFKRALYEMFLQKYHAVFHDGNTAKFNYIRKYARYNVGNPKVYYVFNHIVLREREPFYVNMPFTESLLKDLYEFGYYSFWFAGHYLIMEIFPFLASPKRKLIYLQNQANSSIIRVRGDERMFELTDIAQMDPFYLRFNGR